jgi:hypothetical protein
MIDEKVKMKGKKERKRRIRKERKNRGKKYRKVKILFINSMEHEFLSCDLDHKYVSTWVI